MMQNNATGTIRLIWGGVASWVEEVDVYDRWMGGWRGGGQERAAFDDFPLRDDKL